MRESPSARGGARLLALVLLGGAATGCPESLSQLCPDNTRQEGLFTASITLQPNNPSECRVTSDGGGGVPDASIADSTRTFSSALCTSQDVDGGLLLSLAVAQSSVVRSSPLADGGLFAFSTETLLPAATVPCGCDLQVIERISGRIVPAQEDAGVLLADGGLTVLSGFTGTLIDLVDGGGPLPDGGNGCFCNVPCTLAYDLAATKQ